MKVVFIDQSGGKREFVALAGQTLLDVARQNGIDEVEGACDGAMSCSTCHLIIDAEWYPHLPAAKPEEMDMLDLASGITRTSRLGCQIRLTDAMDGLVVKLP